MESNYGRLVKRVFDVCQNLPEDVFVNVDSIMEAVKEYETAEATDSYLKTLTQSQREKYKAMALDELPEAMRHDFYELRMEGFRGWGAVAVSELLYDIALKVDFGRAARAIVEG